MCQKADTRRTGKGGGKDTGIVVSLSNAEDSAVVFGGIERRGEGLEEKKGSGFSFGNVQFRNEDG